MEYNMSDAPTIEELLETHPMHSQAYRSAPVPHFVYDKPNLYTGSLKGGYPMFTFYGAEYEPQSTFHTGRQTKLYNSLLDFPYRTFSPHKTERGYSRKFSITCKLKNGKPIDRARPSNEFPLNDLYDYREINNLFYYDVNSIIEYAPGADYQHALKPSLFDQAYNIWLPSLYPNSKYTAAKLKTTVHRDRILVRPEVDYDNRDSDGYATIKSRKRFLHRWQKQDNAEVLLKITAPLGGFPGFRWRMKAVDPNFPKDTRSGDVTSFELAVPGYGYVTSPAFHPYWEKLDCINENHLTGEMRMDEGVLIYITWEILP